MIALLQGELHTIKSDFVILLTGGVGYRVEVSTPTSQSLSKTGSDQITLFIYHHITEGDQRLFGFLSTDEKGVFELLITVKGIGPRLALTILSGMNPATLMEAIHSGQAKILSTIPGIGLKTAERMVLELKDKLFSPAGSPSSQTGATSQNHAEAIAALEALGFKKKDTESAVLSILNEDPSLDTGAIIRKALATLKS
jgi:Holliday junction DNA helicase RuvA